MLLVRPFGVSGTCVQKAYLSPHCFRCINNAADWTWSGFIFWKRAADVATLKHGISWDQISLGLVRTQHVCFYFGGVTFLYPRTWIIVMQDWRNLFSIISGCNSEAFTITSLSLLYKNNVGIISFKKKQSPFWRPLCSHLINQCKFFISRNIIVFCCFPKWLLCFCQTYKCLKS